MMGLQIIFIPETKKMIMILSQVGLQIFLFVVEPNMIL